MRIRNYLLVAGAIGLSGCASYAIKDMAAYRPAPLLKSPVMPTTEEIKAPGRNIVVYDPDAASFSGLKDADLGPTIAGAVREYLADAGMTVVDRAETQRMTDELKIIERLRKGGGRSYKGPSVANYVAAGKIDSARLTKEFVAKASYKKKDGSVSVTPAHCDMKAEVSATIDIYKLPEAVMMKALHMSSSTYRSVETSDTDCSLADSDRNALLQKTASNAVFNGKDELKNVFAPKGYVLEHRTGEGRDIFKVSIGRNRGLKPGDDIEIDRSVISENPLTHASSMETYKVGDGAVSDQIGDDYAWIVVKDKDMAHHVRMGHIAKVVYSTGWLATAGHVVTSSITP